MLPRREVLKLENQGEVVGAIARIGSLLRSQEGVEQRLPLHGSRHLGRHGLSGDPALWLPGGWHPLMAPGAMACPLCGSWSVKADRSLAGRLVCGRCARPLGAAQTPRRQRRSRSRRPGLSLGIGLLALLALAALLAAWDQQRLRFTAPPERLVPNSQPRTPGLF
ncbi:hypothetical protein [Cyanobium usitatum]|uniref:hypothetical protein n=1 Tax=Cyanobium usitatum TaxID=2304190 RepID=UPI002AD20390|nr:hypothetical protein [Cyanobium usitatum]